MFPSLPWSFRLAGRLLAAGLWACLPAVGQGTLNVYFPSSFYLSEDGTKFARTESWRFLTRSYWPGGSAGPASHISRVSHDLRAIVLTNESSPWVTFWSEPTGFVPLSLAGVSVPAVSHISRDGTTVVGHDVGNPGQQRAWHAVPGTSGVLRELGTLGGATSSVSGLSHDGSVVVGTSTNLAGDRRAFRWKAATETMQDLGSLGGAVVSAKFVSVDGSVVVGVATTVDGEAHVYRWTVTSGVILDLGTLGGPMSEPTFLSADGSVVIGESIDAGGLVRTFRWTEAGGMQPLLDATWGKPLVLQVLAEGSVAVGVAVKGSERRVFRFSASAGVEDLATLPGPLDGTLAISLDGTSVVGDFVDGGGARRHFRWREAGRIDFDLPESAEFPRLSRDGTVLIAGFVPTNGAGETRVVLWSEPTGAIEIGRLLEGLGSGFGDSIFYARSVSAFSFDGAKVRLFGSGPPPSAGPGGPHSLSFFAEFDLPVVPVSPLPPLVSTRVPAALPGKAFVIGGEVEDEGGAPVTDRRIRLSRAFFAGGENIVLGSGPGVFETEIGPTLLADTVYEVHASATNLVGTTPGAAVRFTTPPAPVLTWQDIGAPARAGGQTRTASSDQYLITAGGADMWGSSDQFRFGHEGIEGDARLVARFGVPSGVEASPWARTGLSFRASLAPDAAHVSLIRTVGNGVDLQWRAVAGGPTAHLVPTVADAAGAGPDLFLRLERAGNRFSAFQSADGVAWSPVGGVDVALPGEARAGLLASAVSETQTVQARASLYFGQASGVGRRVELAGDGEFGSVTVGTTSVRAFSLRNAGAAPLTVARGEAPDGFAIALGGGFVLAPGETRAVSVGFSPAATGVHEGGWSVFDDNDELLGAMTLGGTGTLARSPLTWVDIGDPAVAGHQTFLEAEGRHVVSAGGADMWGGSDEFRFGYGMVPRDAQVTLFVESLDGPHPWSRVGVGWRASLEASAPHVALIVSRDNGIDLQWREQSGGETRRIGEAPGSLGLHEAYLRLTRIGGRFIAEWGDDGIEWRPVGETSVALPATALAGVVVSAVAETGPARTRVDLSMLETMLADVRLPATITLQNLAQTYTGAPRVVTAATSPPGLNVVLTYAGSTVAPSAAGNHAVEARIEDAAYAGVATATLTVAKAGQTIAFAPLADRVFGQPPLALSAVATSGLPVAFTVASGPAAMVGDVLVVSGVGPVVVRATQAGDDNHLVSPVVERTFIVAKGSATIALGGLAQTYTGAPRVVTATTSPPGLNVVLTYGGATVAPSAAGSHAVEARIEDAAYTGVAAATLTVAKAGQTIAFAPLADRVFGQPPLALSAVATSGLPVAFTVASGPAAMVGDVLVVSGVGPVVVRATQAGDDNHLVSPVVERTFIVAKGSATIALGGLAQTYTGAPRVVTATTSPPGLNVVLTYGGATVAPSAAGSHAVEARIEDAAYTGVAAATLTVAKAGQTIAFAPLADRVFGQPPLALSAVATSGLPVAFTVLSGPAVVAGDTLVVLGGGVVVLRATQFGDANHDPAPPVERSLAVGAAVATVVLSDLEQIHDGAPRRVGMATVPAGLAVRVTYDGGVEAPVAAGAYAVEVVVTEPHHEGSARGTLVIAPAPLAPPVGLVNLSTRGFSGGGEDVLIIGFVLHGTGDRRVLLRAVGPTLAAHGVAEPLADPRIGVSLPGAGAPLAANDDWGAGGDAGELSRVMADAGAFGLPPSSRDAALVVSLAAAGHTAVISSANGGSGIALGEVYSLAGPGSGLRLANLSSRGRVGRGEEGLIAGFVIAGAGGRTVLLRGVGPGLRKFEVEGVLADPRLRLVRDGGTILANDDWSAGGNAVAIENAAREAGAFPLDEDSRDAAALVTLAPGAYTVVLSGADDGTGVALLEVYDLE